MFKQWLTSRRAGSLTLAVVVVIAAGGGWALGATTTSSSVIHGCASKHGGALRLARIRQRNERAISWNAHGIPAKNGTNGTNGTSGTTGRTGRRAPHVPTDKSTDGTPRAPERSECCSPRPGWPDAYAAS